MEQGLGGHAAQALIHVDYLKATVIVIQIALAVWNVELTIALIPFQGLLTVVTILTSSNNKIKEFFDPHLTEKFPNPWKNLPNLEWLKISQESDEKWNIYLHSQLFLKN